MGIDEIVQAYQAESMSTAELVRALEGCVRHRLSEGQKGLWTVYKSQPGTYAYNVPLCISCPATLALDRLQQAYHFVLDAHPVLTAVVGDDDGQPCMLFRDTAHFKLESVDARAVEPHALHEYLVQRIRIPFDLERGPLIRLEVVQTSGSEVLILIVAHHIVLDGYSSRLLLAWLLGAYDDLTHGRQLTSARSGAGYADFVAWEQAALAGEQGVAGRDYWSGQLAGVEPLDRLPRERAWHPALEPKGEVLSHPLSAPRRSAVEQWAAAHGVSQAAFFLAVFKLLLMRYTGQGDLVVGMPAMVRPEERFEHVVGHFINMLPVRSRPEEDETFPSYAKRLQGTLFEAIDHGAYPFSRQVRDLGATSRNASAPLFQVSYNYQGLGEAGTVQDLQQRVRDSLPFKVVPGLYQAGEYELSLDVLPDDGVILNFKYHPDLYSAATIARMCAHYLNLVDAVLAADAPAIGACSLLSAEERRTLLEEGNHTDTAYPAGLRCDQLFAAQVRMRPEAPAVSHNDVTLTYSQLDARSNQLVRQLQDAGVGPDDRVGICLERSVDMLASLLAVMKAGAAYMPLDPACPPTRLKYMIETSDCRLILTQRALVERLLVADLPPAALVLVDGPAPSATPVDAAVASRPDSLAYVMFTSGSTGQPKGVMVPHRALTNFLSSVKDKLAFGERERVLAVTTYCFDIAALELYLPLVSGGHCVICDADTTRDAALLMQEIARTRPTLMQATPATWNMLFRVGWRNGERTRILCGGEALSEKLKQLFIERDCDVWDMYGPTETTIWSSMQHVSAGVPISIGQPIANTRMYILDRRLEPVPPGVIGELCIAGDGVALGYCKNPGLSAERFIDSPFRSGERIYRTGDLARRLANGDIALIGRGDNQVKLRGFRVELGEVETALNAHPGVGGSVAVVVGDAGEGARLVAYVTARTKPAGGADPATEPPDAGSLRAFLGQTLPDYMIPAEFIRLDEFPLTPNGKVDRNSLGRAGQQEAASPQGLPAPQVEDQVRRIFENVLKHANFGRDDRFFDIGGDSFTAILAVEQINAHFGCQLRVTSLFKYPTVAAFASLLHDERAHTGSMACAHDTPRPPASAAPGARDTANANTDEYAGAIAIVGISCQFPDAENHREFWSNLANGRDSMRFVPEDELRASGLPAELLKNPNFVPQHASLRDKASFDAAFFSISPRDAELMDPQGRLLLQHAWKAVEDAGYDVKDIPETSVFMSAANNFYQALLPGVVANTAETRVMCSASEYVAWVLAQGGSIPTMISNKLGLKGPSLFVSTNCSSSIVGLHQACQGLLAGDVDQALVGAATVFPGTSLGYLHQPGLNLSGDGRCKAFDARADGMVGGEGAAVVMLKRARDAIADGDHIYALIRGIAVNNDGGDKAGFYAPSVQGQSSVIRKVLDRTGINPETIRYVEAHGTGTRIGDPIEVMALSEAYQHYTQRRQFCAIGSVKTNIGHLDAAAGMAGLIKLALSLEHGEIPPTLNYTEPNPEIDFAGSPFYVAARHQRFESGGTEPVRAALSSFGLGGTNAHAILEQYRDQRTAAQRGSGQVGSCLVLLSGQDQARLAACAEVLLAFIPIYRNEAGTLADLAYTTQVGRRPMACRLALLVDDLGSLETALARFLGGATLPQGCFSSNSGVLSTGLPALIDSAAELEALTAAWLKAGQLQKLAQAWVAGSAVTWPLLYTAHRPRRVSLPTYEFAKKRFWIGPAAQAAPAAAQAGASTAAGLLERLAPALQDNASAALAQAAPGGDIAGMLGAHAQRVAQLDRVLVKLLWRQLLELGLFREPETLSGLARQLDADQTRRRWLEHSVRILAEHGYLARDDEQFHRARDSGAAECAWDEWEAWKAADGQLPEARGRVPLLEAMLTAMPQILRGQARATDVMFPGASLALVEGVYKQNLVADYFNATLANAVLALVRQRRPGQAVRIVEIGAGTGSTSDHVFRRLAQEGEAAVAEYCYTDVSKAFLTRAEQRYGATVPYLKYQVFDVEKPASAQGLEQGAYDIVIATNVLHATRNVGIALANAHTLLRSDGVLLLNEINENDLTMHLTFGLLEGWWRFEDVARRLPGGPALGDAEWRKVMQEAGFHPVYALAPDAQRLGMQQLAGQCGGRPDVVVTANVDSAARVMAASPRLSSATAAATGRVRPGAADAVEGAIMQTLSASLKLGLDEIATDVSFSDYGLDSLTGVDLVNQLNRTLGIGLMVTSLFDYPTVIQLKQHILTQFGARLAQAGPAPSQYEPMLPECTVPPQAPLPDAGAAPASAATGKEPIAIIGMSGRFPQADDVDEFWTQLAQGADLVESVTRWDLGGTPGTCHDGGFMRDIAHFDPLFFNISGLEASYMEPQQRIFLEEAWKALEDAGYAGAAVDKERCGVYVGCTSGDYFDLSSADAYPAQAFWGNMSSMVPSRIAYYLNLRGPALAVDTACSSSLVAIHLACQSLWSRETGMAIAGGVFVQCSPRLYIAGTRAGMLSPSGRCRAFDDGADGFVPAEGAGVLILKRLTDAVRDGDHIHGVIRGSGLNQDGTTNGITAPSANSQQRLEQQVYEEFGVDCEQIQMIEAHGTGTRLGDPIEFQALAGAFRSQTDRQSFCALGSSKANIGHAQMAAGVIGIIKILMAMKHRQIPPALHYRTTNANIALQASPFYINTEPVEWTVSPGTRRRAAISSFGASGTNAHLVIEEEAPPVAVPRARQLRLIVLSARSADQLRQVAIKLGAYCQAHADVDVADISYTLLLGRKHFSHRLAVVAEDTAGLGELLAKWTGGAATKGIFCSEAAGHANGALTGPAAANSIEEMARQFVRGATPQLAALFDGGVFRRVALPTYPFARETYWLPGQAIPGRAVPAAAVVATPVPVASAAGAPPRLHSTTLTGQEFYLRDHKVRGNAILPGAQYLELANAATLHSRQGQAAGFRNVVLVRPVVVGARPVQLHTVLEGTNGAQFEVYTDAATAGAERVVHCRGEVMTGHMAAIAPLDLPDLRARYRPQAISPGQFYADYAAIGIQYGTSFQCFQQAYTAPGAVLARLRLPDVLVSTRHQHVFHPALLDGALQCMRLLSADGQTLGQARLLFAIQEVRHGAPLQPEIWAWIRYAGDAPADGTGSTKIDIDLVDDQGRVCVALRGVTTRAAPTASGGAARGTAAPTAVATLLPLWEPVPCGGGLRWPTADNVVGIIGTDCDTRKLLQQYYPAGRTIELAAGCSADEIAAELQACPPLDHLIWVGRPPAPLSPSAEQLIEGQADGPTAIFRLFKALLTCGYGNRNFGLTFITHYAHSLHPGDPFDPVLAGISGLVGSLAKEYPNWKVRSADLPLDDAGALQGLLALGPDVDGNTSVYRRGQWHRQQLIPLAAGGQGASRFRTGGVCVIVGGAGGLGRAISEYLIRRYRMQIVWLGRRARDAAIDASILALSALGPAPCYLQVDVADAAALRQAHGAITRQFGQVHGLIQSALVFDGASLERMSEQQFHSVLRAKVDASARLMAEFGDEPLDVVLFISSINSYLKAMGQGNYAAACTFKDGLALHLTRTRPAVKVINLGYCFNNAGAQQGVPADKAPEFIERDELMAGIETLVASHLSQMTLMKFSPSQNTRGITLGEDRALAAREDVPSCLDSIARVVPSAGPDELARIRERMQALSALAI